MYVSCYLSVYYYGLNYHCGVIPDSVSLVPLSRASQIRRWDCTPD